MINVSQNNQLYVEDNVPKHCHSQMRLLMARGSRVILGKRKGRIGFSVVLGVSNLLSLFILSKRYNNTTTTTSSSSTTTSPEHTTTSKLTPATFFCAAVKHISSFYPFQLAAVQRRFSRCNNPQPTFFHLATGTAALSTFGPSKAHPLYFDSCCCWSWLPMLSFWILVPSGLE
jgi:hypothetical protein